MNCIADNTLIISGIGGGIFNAKAGDYNILFQLSESGTLARSQSLIFTIESAALSGVSVSPFTLDRAKYTLYEISFNAPEALSAGNHPSSIANAQTRIRLEFQTAQAATDLFSLDLGRNETTSGSTIPCYGADYLKRRKLKFTSTYVLSLSDNCKFKMYNLLCCFSLINKSCNY